MNIIQLHDKVLAFLDQTRSGRIDPHMLDASINTVIDASVKQRIGSENVVGPNGFYPMESGRIKDSLGYYYKIEELDVTSSNINVISALLAAQKSPLMLLDSVEVNIGTKSSPTWITPTPINKKDQQENSGNTFLAPNVSTWKNTYYSYNGRYLDLLLPSTISKSQIRLGYYAKPAMVNHGTLVSATDFLGTSVSVIFYSRSTYASAIKLRGEEASITKASFANGSIVRNFGIVDIDPEILEQVCMGAAKIISGMKIGVLNEPKEG